MTNTQDWPGGLQEEDCKLLEELLEEVLQLKKHLKEVTARVDNLGEQIRRVLQDNK